MQNLDFVVDDRVGIATLDMPDRPFNVFSEDMIDELIELTEEIERRASELDGVVITSGKSAFMAGADLPMVQGYTTLRHHASHDEIRASFSRLTHALRRLEKVPVTTVAAVNGLALGGGLELAMACHYRVVVDQPTPCLGLPEILLGLLPGAGGTQRLPRLTSPAFAAKVLLDGAPVTPAVALDAGLVHKIVKVDELIEVAVELARNASPGAPWDREKWSQPSDDQEILEGDDAFDRLCGLGWARSDVVHLYPAFGAIARCLLDGFQLPFDQGMNVEIENFLGLMLNHVAGNMVRTSFISKTAAAKVAAAECHAPTKELPSTITLAGLSELPKKIARLEIASGQSAISLCRHPSQIETSTAVRYAGNFSSIEGVEISGPENGQALALANKLRLTPVVTKDGKSLLTQLLNATSDWTNASGLGPDQLASIAAETDLYDLFERAGVVLSEPTERFSAARAKGLELLLHIASTASDCLNIGDISQPESVDVLAVFAAGFPAWTGGPLSFLDTVARGDIEDSPELPTPRSAPHYLI